MVNGPIEIDDGIESEEDDFQVFRKDNSNMDWEIVYPESSSVEFAGIQLKENYVNLSKEEKAKQREQLKMLNKKGPLPKVPIRKKALPTLPVVRSTIAGIYFKSRSRYRIKKKTRSKNYNSGLLMKIKR